MNGLHEYVVIVILGQYHHTYQGQHMHKRDAQNAAQKEASTLHKLGEPHQYKVVQTVRGTGLTIV